MMNHGKTIYGLCEELFPICRSITGEGVRQTLAILKRHLPGLKIHAVPSGTKAFDWTVPREWNIRDAYVETPDGERIIDFKKHNLHVVGYSTPIDEWVDFETLDRHLHSLPDQPDAIPYVTSYYREYWGFCLEHNERGQLDPAIKYHVVIDSALEYGVLNYGELIIPGETEKEIFLSTYICHPSMANNELSGPAVVTALAEWLQERPRRYTYRIIFIPETIGSIVYLSKNIDEMKKKVIAGFVVTCVGDNKTFSYLESPYANTLADKAAQLILQEEHPEYKRYRFLQRGSDERQYCAPGVDLPVVSVMRSKYGEYPEYHTSLDNLDFISPEGLEGAFYVYKKIIEALEANREYRLSCLCEPQLGKRGLFPTTSTKDSWKRIQSMMDVIAYLNGKNDLLDIAETTGTRLSEIYSIIERLKHANLIEE